MKTLRKTILIVDDVELNRVILGDLFKNDFDILEAENGDEAIRIIDARYNELAIIFLDIVMPVRDGFSVMEHLNQQHDVQRVPVFLITADNSDEFINRGYDMGADDIIQKPFIPSIIRRRVQSTLELFRARFDMESLLSEQSKELVQQAEKLRSSSEQMIDALSTAIEFRDCESGEHIRRVRGITRILLDGYITAGYDECLTPDQIEQISMASAMHDIGKIAIPDGILNKAGKLTDAEFEIMKTHTVRGCDLLDQIDSIRNDGTYQYYHDICRWHHEKWDGKGYPDGLKGEQIPIWSQVVAVADCYDALVSDRVYKKTYSHKTAIKMILDGACGAFNPNLLQTIVNVGDAIQYGEEKVAHSIKVFPRHETVTASNVSDRALRLIEMERHRYRQLMQLSNEAIFTYFAESRIVEQSDRMMALFGGESSYTVSDLEALFKSEVHPDDVATLKDCVKSISPDSPSFATEVRFKTLRNPWEWCKLRVTSSWDIDERGRCTSIVGRVRSIDAMKRELMQWKNQANVDALTGVLNRYGLTTTIEQIIEQGDKKERFALFMIDVDNFKQVNDTHGHLFGDKILHQVADILRNSMRTEDVVGRIGGDEFVIVMRDIDSPDHAAKKAAEISRKVIALSERQRINISSSIGIALYPTNETSFKGLVEKADKALYTAKHTRRGDVRFYSSVMEASNYISSISLPDKDSTLNNGEKS